MDNHFGKGLMAGLSTPSMDSARSMANFCVDYRRGFVPGFSHRMFEKTGGQQLGAWKTGILTCHCGLDKGMVMDLFKENQSSTTTRLFMAGYRLEARSERGTILF